MASRARRLIAASVLLAVALPALAAAQAFLPQALSVKGKILEVIPADVSGDGLKDLVVVFRAGLEPRFELNVAVFVQRPGRGFGVTPDAVSRVGAEFGLIDVAPAVAGGKAESIYLLSHDGLYRWPMNGGGLGKPQLLRKQPGLAVVPDDSQLPNFAFVRPWKGNGRMWAMLPGFDRLSFIPLDDLAAPAEEVAIKADYHASAMGTNAQGSIPYSLSSTVEIPVLAVEDANGDGRKDLVVARGEEVWCYFQGADGKFSVRPDRTQTLPVRTKDERVLRNTNVITSVYDLNGDGLADVVLNKFGGSFPKLRSTTHVHLGRRGGPFRAEPDTALDSEGFAGFIRFVNVNGDGRRDLVMPISKLGISDMIRVIVRKTLNVTFAVFLQRPDGSFAQTPDYERDIVYICDWRAGLALVGISPNFEGDFNHDGKADLLVGKGSNSVEVYLGGRTPGRMFGTKPDATVPCPASISYRVDDLNGDGYSDFYVFYPLEPKLEGTLKVFLNQRQWR